MAATSGYATALPRVGSLPEPLNPPAAPIGRRAAAALIDLAVIAGGEVVALLFAGVLLEIVGGSTALRSQAALQPAAAIVLAVAQLVVYAGPAVYLDRTWRRGASVGMRAMGCRLCSPGGFAAPTSSQVVLRLCGLAFSVAFLGLGLLWGWFRRDRRGWSDLFAGTVVTRLQPWPVPPPVPPAVHAPDTPAGGSHWTYSPWPVPGAAPAGTGSSAGSSAVRDRSPWRWTDVLPVVVLLLPLSIAVEYVTVLALKTAMHGVPLETRRPIEAVVSDATAYGAVFLLVVLFVKVRRHASLAALGLRRPQWRWLAAALPFAYAAFVLQGIAGRLSDALFPQTPANQCVSIRDAYSGALWLAIIGVALIGPLVEEIVFRGMVFGWLRGRTPVTWAIVISAAIFSLEHIGFLQLTLFLPIFAAGIVLAFLYQHARSVWPTFIVHGLFNLIGLLALFSAASC